MQSPLKVPILRFARRSLHQRMVFGIRNSEKRPFILCLHPAGPRAGLGWMHHIHGCKDSAVTLFQMALVELIVLEHQHRNPIRRDC